MKLLIALLQLPVDDDPKINLSRAIDTIKDVKRKNPKLRLIVLPECFNAPYSIECFPKYAETIPTGPTCKKLSETAKSLQIYIIGGSIIERDVETDKLYNTCTIWSPHGNLIGRHRKIHLFKVNISREMYGGVRFDEGLALTAGNNLTVVEVDNHKIGIGICHDKRFAELAHIYRKMGCEMLIYPSAFCICQGPMHWELLQRSRANDNQVFVATCAPARDNMTGYVDYGHSMIVDPWGRVQYEAGESMEIVIQEIDFDMVKTVREQIQLEQQRRTDVYDTVVVGGK